MLAVVAAAVMMTFTGRLTALLLVLAAQAVAALAHKAAPATLARQIEAAAAAGAALAVARRVHPTALMAVTVALVLLSFAI